MKIPQTNARSLDKCGSNWAYNVKTIDKILRGPTTAMNNDMMMRKNGDDDGVAINNTLLT